MNLIFNKIEPTIKIAQDIKSPDLLAYSSLKLLDEHGRHLTINGLTVRKSKFDNSPYLTPPTKATGKGTFFKFLLADKTLWKEIEKEIIDRYVYESIPIIN